MNELIQGYQMLYSSRLSTSTIKTIDELVDIIRIELLDELTHPRVRKSPEEKLSIAMERIDKSNMMDSVKEPLKQLYVDVLKCVNIK